MALEDMTSAESFVNIRTMYHAGLRREIDSLAELYNDPETLSESIKSLTSQYLTAERIRGKRILLKPNWVRHELVANDRFALCTHESFILSVLDLVLSFKPASVVIGDAPIQGCKWQRLLQGSFYEQIDLRRQQAGVPISIKDFRRVIFDADANDLTQTKDNLDEFVIFDVGKRSFLEPITHPTKNRFRVTVYNPDRFVESHAPGMHKYCITRELFESDVVISLPKIKTHQKTGITAALKNIVGINGDKDFLPHHRLGGTSRGGDCYPGGSRLRYLTELSYDQANRNRGNWQYGFWIKIGSILWRLSRPQSVHQLAAGWYGNDTTWRMVMDLNLILNYGTKDGRLADSPQRTMFSLCDGIIGGQGNGPLDPEPLNLGVITFTNHGALHDVCCALLMGMDVTRIPLLVAALSMYGKGTGQIRINGSSAGFDDLKPFAVEARMPPGWVDYRSQAPVVDLARVTGAHY
jgi:uncharacterized protein (DUF362 family)